jgi:hypothetical protein
MHNTTVLHPDVPLFPLEQPLNICQWLHTLAERELKYWPRRHVWVTPLVYPQIPCPGACAGVYTVLLCLN